MMNQFLVKNAAAVLMLMTVATVQPVLAQTMPAEAPAPVVIAQNQTIEPEYKPTVQDVLTVVCMKRGYGTDCAKTLFGMLWTESSNRSTVIGDGGAARGYFQIHYKLHKITTACAEDLVCSANWTITYMERHSYPKYTAYAVQCHNSCGVKNGYAAKTVRNANLLWETPMEIKQAAPIDFSTVTVPVAKVAK